MSNRYDHWLGIVFCLVVAGSLFADDKKGDSKDKEKSGSLETVLHIDPVGRPNMSAQDGTKVYVWRDDMGWHLRTNAKYRKKGKSLTKFGGVIQIEDGRVIGLQSISGLEGKGKGMDAGWLSPEKKTIRFEFETTGRGEDGFDFQVSDGSKSIRFDLRIEGYDHPEQILLGLQRHRAPAGVFILSVPNKKSDP